MPSPPPVLFSSAAFFARPLSWTFRLAAESGYGGVEVMVTKDPESQDPKRIRALADGFGLTVGALHAPRPLLTIEGCGVAASDADIPVVVVHPPYRWQRAFRRWLIEDLPSLEERTGIAVAVENMFPVRLAGRDVTFHSNQDLEQLEGPPHLVLDTSHAAVAKHDLIEVRKLFGERLRHVHLSDNAGKGWDSHLPPGEGVLDLDAFLLDLAGSDFAGVVSLEVDLRKHFQDRDALATTMIDMRERTERALASAGRTAR